MGAEEINVPSTGIKPQKKTTVESRAMGSMPSASMYLVILPQAWRTILPPVGNEFIALLKDTSLVSILGVADLLRRGREYASESFEYFETFTMSRTRAVASTTHQPLPLSILAGGIFFFLTWAGIKGLKCLETKVRIPGYAHQGTL